MEINSVLVSFSDRLEEHGSGVGQTAVGPALRDVGSGTIPRPVTIMAEGVAENHFGLREISLSCVSLCAHMCFFTLASGILCPGSFFVGRAVLCMIRYLAALLASTCYMPVTPLPPPPSVLTTKNCSRLGQMSFGSGGQNFPGLRSTALCECVNVYMHMCVRLCVRACTCTYIHKGICTHVNYWGRE